MTEDTFVDRNQFRGDPTLDGVSEGSLSSLTGFFGSLANTYATVKGALDNKNANPSQVPKQAVGASTGFKGGYVTIAIAAVAAVLLLVLLMRK